MTDSKIYLNVPFAQKDEAKGFGARWDAAAKKWYVPAGKELTVFAKWQLDSANAVSHVASIAPKAPRSGVFTPPSIANFVAYAGDTPPWD